MEFINNIPWRSIDWIRPDWFWAIPLAILLALLLQKIKTRELWNKLIASDKLPWLLQGSHGFSKLLPFIFLIICLIAIIALAGPTWEKRPQPTSNNPDGLVIVFDLSPSMYATDIRPSRLVRAKLKITDLLRARKDGQTALVAYAGDAHVVSPLTTDAKTIIGLVQALDPGIMPSKGSSAENGVELATQLLQSAGIRYGHILMVTDEINAKGQMQIKRILNNTNNAFSKHRLSILGVGTESGSPIPSQQNGNGNFLRSRNGQVILAILNRNELEILAATQHGRYISLKTDDSDIDYLLDKDFSATMLERLQPNQDNTSLIENQQYSDWIDQGAWLVLLVLPFALLLFRRGWLYAISLLILLPQDNHIQAQSIQQTPTATQATPTANQPPPVNISAWDKLWLNRNQQAAKLLDSQPDKAAEKFTSDEWKAIANYQSKNYEQSLTQLANIEGAQSLVNQSKVHLANQDAKSALESLDDAIKQARQENNFDIEQQAEDFKKVIQWMLEQQQQQQQDQSQQDDENQEQEQSQDEQQQSESQEQESQQQQSSQDEDSEEESEEEQQQSETAEEEESEDKSEEEMEEPSEEEIQALQRQRWLETIVDDPGGLLRRKFQYEAEQRRNNREPPTEDERY